jgi:hypothetical protein
MSNLTDPDLRAKAQEAAKAYREQRKAAGLSTRRTPYERSQDNPTSLRLAINAMCWQCQGEDADPNNRGRIRECQITGCALWGLRPL